MSQGALVFPTTSRPKQGLHELALSVALEHGMLRATIVAYGNLSDDTRCSATVYRDCLDYLEQSIPLARRIGDRRNEWFMLAEQSYVLSMLGRWDEAVARAAELPDELLGTDT